MIRSLAPLAPLALLGLLVSPAPAVEPAPCQLGGPAGTASVVRVDLPHGSPSLALRVTTPVGASAASPQTVGTRSSWHLATQIAVLRAGSGALVATRVLQSGSNPRAVAVSAQGQQVREDAPGPGVPFVHAAAQLPAYLGPGRYLLVAYGTDGSAALPNPGWSAEAAFGTVVSCVPLQVRTRLLDRDQTSFAGGTQVSALGAGTGSGTTAAWRLADRYVVGFADAATQLVGDAHVHGALPGGRAVDARNGVRPFTAGPGGYRFAADWTGVFPLVLVCAMAFTA